MSGPAGASGSFDFAEARWRGLRGMPAEIRVSSSVNWRAEAAARLSLLQDLPGLAANSSSSRRGVGMEHARRGTPDAGVAAGAVRRAVAAARAFAGEGLISGVSTTTPPASLSVSLARTRAGLPAERLIVSAADLQDSSSGSASADRGERDDPLPSFVLKRMYDADACERFLRHGTCDQPDCPFGHMTWEQLRADAHGLDPSAVEARRVELAARGAKRRLGTEAVAAVRRVCAAKDMSSVIASFFPNSEFGVGGDPLDNPEVTRLLGDIQQDVRFYRADSTWVTYAGPWRRAWAWCSRRLEETGVVKPTVADLAAYKQAAWAYVKRLQQENATPGVVATACTAINFAFKMNRLDDGIMNELPAQMLRQSMRRQLGAKVKKATELTEVELLPVVDLWGFGEVDERRQTALLMAMGRGMLARFDDLAKLRVKNMLFFPEGVLLCMPIRKNRQFGGYMWVPLAESGRRIRAMTSKQAAHWEQARRLAGDAAYVTHTAAQSAARRPLPFSEVVTEATPELLLGCCVHKYFEGHGTFCGEVKSVHFDGETNANWWHVVYDDGDEEDLTDAELLRLRPRRPVAAGSLAGADAADGHFAASTVMLLRAHLSDLGFAVPEPHPEGAEVGLGTAESLDVFLFRDISVVRGARRDRDDDVFAGRRRAPLAGDEASKVYALGDGATPMNNTTYRYVLKRSRLALRECCGYSEETAKTFGTHSWRRGGDTALFRSGLSQQQRQLMGMWQTPTVELGYVGYTARQHMSWSRACAL